MKIVSIIICCFNGEKFINQCFGYVLKQTYKHLEVVFIDDGSTDNSFDVASSYKDLFQSNGMVLKCLTQENKGAGGAAALGLKYATGDYICCYDIDDILYPESIEKRVTFLNTHSDYAIVRTNGYRTVQKQDGTIEKYLFVNDQIEKKNEDLFEPILFWETNNWSGSYMVRSETLWKVYPDHQILESRYGQNLQILLASSYQNKSGFIDIPLMEYLYNADSFTNKRKDFIHSYNLLKGFYDIRVGIINHLCIKDSMLLTRLDVFFCKKFLDLAITFDNSELYINTFKQLSKLEKPSFLYYFHYFRFKKNPLGASFYRVMNFLEKKFTK